MNENTTETSVKVGDIFEMSWGYDQTNVNFFQITRLSKGGIFIREISSKGVPGTDGFMCQNVVAVKDSFLDHSQWCGDGDFTDNVETFRRLKPDSRPCFSFRGRYYAYLWDGKPTYCSWYA